MAFNSIYKNKKVLVTGSTGFKGSWLCSWLCMLGADVYGYALNIPTNPSMYEILGLDKRVHQHYGDIRNKEELRDCINEVRPVFIIHLALSKLFS